MSGLRIVIALTYYRPHISGLSIYAERLARALVGRGHRVAVLTSRHDPQLPRRESLHGVEVVRVPVVGTLGKGVLMPGFLPAAAALVRDADVLNVHMPQLEAAPLAVIGRVAGAGVVVTYHCDLLLPAGVFNRAVQAGVAPLNHVAARLAQRLVCSTRDYAQHSRFLCRYTDKVAVIFPPLDVPPADPAATARLAARWEFSGRPQIGFAGRFAAEKGVELLLTALPAIVREIPDVRLVFTGACRNTRGEQQYFESLRPLLQAHPEHIALLDLLTDGEMPSFYALCDVVAVPSVNSTEAFGMVQVEAMLEGTPVVASDLPGVREAVRRTGMGEIVPLREPAALAAALVRVLRQRAAYVRPRAEVAQRFDVDESVRRYEAVFAESGRRR